MTPRARFDAYLRRHALCRGGAVSAAWSDDGASVVVSDADGHRRVSLADGSSEPGDPPPSAPPARTWLRGWYIGDMPVPEVPSPDGRWFASVEDCNLRVRSTRDGRTRALTTDGSPDLCWDLEALRGRLLPGLQVETSFTSPWRPDGGALFACKRDIAGVFRMPTVHWLRDFESVDYAPFEKAGARIDRFHPHIVDLRRQAAVPVDVGPVEDRYVQLLGWRPDGREVFVVSYSRDLTEARIVAADGETGASREVLVETGATFLRIQHDTLFGNAHGFAFLPDGSGFLWLSERSGWRHVYRYDMDGERPRALTRGDWPVHDIRHVGDAHAYLTGSPDPARPYDVHVCRVPLAGGAVERLTDAPGVHRPTFAPAGGAFLDTHSAADRPLATDLRRGDGALVASVARMDVSALEAAGYCAPEEFSVAAADGETALWGVLYKPADFDPTKSYPLVEHIYGGPQISAVARHFSVFERPARNLPWALAQLGCVVVSLDARGTPGRSKAFQDVVHGAWGVHEIADHAAALRQLIARHAWLDPARVGIFGHSWGAYFATAALIQAPDLYRAAVASSPGYIPRESILYEPYLGLPARNPAAYDRADLTRQAARVTRPLLLFAGTSESGPCSDAMKMTRALIDAGVDHEFVVLPGEHHSYVGAGEAYYIEKTAAFLSRHLGFGADA